LGPLLAEAAEEYGEMLKSRQHAAIMRPPRRRQSLIKDPRCVVAPEMLWG
jgi:hypothetical protein